MQQIIYKIQKAFLISLFGILDCGSQSNLYF